MDAKKDYFAFISYKREDEKWAKWLQHKLEHYRLPTNVRRKNPSLPPNIRPIFKDTTELAAGVLTKEIKEALSSSKYLIIVCSPRAAMSPWVNKEVQTFIDLDGTERIIPFIIEGQPHSKETDNECFPPALVNLPKEKELLGVNINEMGRDAAAIKVVARLFDIKFDTLWQRYNREQKRKRWMWIGIASLISLISLATLGYFIKLNKTIKRQKDNLVEQKERLQNDSIIMDGHIKRIQTDSTKLALQSDSILQSKEQLQNTYNQLQKSQNNLEEANNNLKKNYLQLMAEKDKVNKANRKIMENLARMVAEKASHLVDEGDSYTARRLLLNIIPDDKIPYVPEMEAALRKTYSNDDFVLKMDNVDAASFSYDNNYIMTNSDDCIQVWRVSDGKKICTTNMVNILGIPQDVLFSPVSHNILYTSLDTIVQWDYLHNKKRYFVSSDDKSIIRSAYYNKDASKIISCSSAMKVRIWDVNTLSICHDFIVPDDYTPISSYAYFDIGEQMAVLIGNDKAFIWDINEKIPKKTYNIDYPKILEKRPFLTFDETVLTVYDTKALSRYTNNGLFELIPYWWDPRVEMIKTADSLVVARFYGHKEYVLSAFFSPDNLKIVSSSGDGTIRIFDSGLKEKNYTVNLNHLPYRQIFYDKRDKPMAAYLSNNNLYIYDIRSQKICKQFKCFQDTIWGDSGDFFLENEGIFCLALSPNGKYLATCSPDEDISIWDYEKCKLVKRLHDHYSYVYDIQFTEDDKYLISCSRDQTVKLWNTNNWECIKTYYCDEHISNVSLNQFFINKENTYIIGVYDTGSYLWNINDSISIHHFNGFACFLPNGNILLPSPINEIWSVKNDMLTMIEHSLVETKPYTFSSDGKIMMSTDFEKIMLYNLKNYGLIHTCGYNPRGVKYEAVVFNSKNNEILSLNEEGIVTILPFPPLQYIIEETRKKCIDVPFTPDEKRVYHLN